MGNKKSDFEVNTRKSTKRQTTIYKTLHRKLQMEPD